MSATACRIDFEPALGWREAAPHLGAWCEASRSAASWLPFQEPAWSTAWWAHWARGDGRRRDSFVLWVGRDAAGRPRAFLPSVLSSHLPGNPLRVRVLTPLGPDPNLTELQPLLCRPEDAIAAHQGLLRALAARSREWELVRWAAVPGAVAGLVRAAPGVAPRRRLLPDYLLTMGGSWEAFRSALPRNAKEAMRRAQNAPRRAGVELRFRVLHEPDEVLAFLPEFFRLHAERAGARSLRPHPNVFARPAARAFLSRLAADWSRAGIVRVLALLHDGRPVACRLAFQMADTLYLYYSGFDPRYARLSIMTRALVDGLEWAARRGVRVVNLSTGSDLSKTRWRPVCCEYETLWQWSGTTRGRWARALWQLFSRDCHD